MLAAGIDEATARAIGEEAVPIFQHILMSGHVPAELPPSPLRDESETLARSKTLLTRMMRGGGEEA